MKHYAVYGLPDYNSTKAAVYSIVQRYPFTSIFQMGESLLGRKIYGITIGQGPKQVLFAGGFHGSEWLTVSLLLRFARELARAVTLGESLGELAVGDAMAGRSLTIVPCVNPDGVEIALKGTQAAEEYASVVAPLLTEETVWQANAAGVDINHNFDAGWNIARRMEIELGIHGPAPSRYGGLSPESEPETRAICTLCRRSDFSHVLAFHSQGEEIYYNYAGLCPGRSEMMAKILSVSSGYTVADPPRIASHAGFKDWFIKTFDRPGFTIEIGKGKNPLPLEELSPIYARCLEMMILAALM